MAARRIRIIYCELHTTYILVHAYIFPSCCTKSDNPYTLNHTQSIKLNPTRKRDRQTKRRKEKRKNYLDPQNMAMMIFGWYNFSHDYHHHPIIFLRFAIFRFLVVLMMKMKLLPSAPPTFFHLLLYIFQFNYICLL